MNEKEIAKEVGRRLRAWRKWKGMSQTDLALQLDVTFQQIQKYENGTNRFPLTKMTTICALYGVTPRTFLPIAQVAYSLNSDERWKEGPDIPAGVTEEQVRQFLKFREFFRKALEQ